MDTPKQPPSVATSALLGWLRGKLADAEKSLSAREQMANTAPITAEEWEEWSKMPGVIVTKGRRMSKAAKKALADKQVEQQLRDKRIAIKCSHEVEMFKAVIAALTPTKKQSHHIAGKITGGTTWRSWQSWESKTEAESIMEKWKVDHTAQDWMRVESCNDDCEHIEYASDVPMAQVTPDNLKPNR